MRKLKLLVLIVLLALNADLVAQGKKPFVLLPASAARALSHLCSREGLRNMQGSWHSATDDIERLESNLRSISRLRTTGGGLGELKGVQISRPFGYYRQYIPVVVGGHKFVYVNAFSYQPPSSWQTRVVDVCDSGLHEWGVLYNPVTEQFSDLRTNAMLAAPPPPPK